MHSTRLTLILLAIAALLVATVPTIQRGYDRLIFARPPAKDFDELRRVAEDADTPELWLAVAELGWQRQAEAAGEDRQWDGDFVPRYSQLMDTWRTAIVRWRVTGVGLRYTLFRLHPLVNTVETEGMGPEALEVLDPDRVEAIRATIDWMRLAEPDNAAPDVIQAWRLLIEEDPDGALQVLQDLEDFDELTIHPTTSAWAALRLAHAMGTPRDTAVHPPEIAWRVWGTLARQVAQRLGTVAREGRAAGDHQRAIRAYAALIGLGEALRENAHHFRGLYLARRVLEEADGASDYLRAQERPQLAERYTAESGRLDRLIRQSERLSYAPTASKMGPAAWAGAYANIMLLWVVLLGLPLGIIFGIRRLRGLQTPALRATWDGWLALLAIMLAPPTIFVIAVNLVFPDRHPDALMVPGIAAPIIGAALWLITMGVAGARNSEDEGDGWWVCWLGQIRAVYWPTLAALVLLGVLGVFPVQRRMEQFAENDAQIAIEGEIAYHGLTEAGVADEREGP